MHEHGFVGDFLRKLGCVGLRSAQRISRNRRHERVCKGGNCREAYQRHDEAHGNPQRPIWPQGLVARHDPRDVSLSGSRVANPASAGLRAGPDERGAMVDGGDVGRVDDRGQRDRMFDEMVGQEDLVLGLPLGLVLVAHAVPR